MIDTGPDEARQAMRDAFAKSGFHVEKALIPVSGIEACLVDLNEVFQRQLSACGIGDPGSLHQRMQALHRADIARYKKVLAALWRLHSVGVLFAQPAITSFLKDFFGFRSMFMPGGQCLHVQSLALRIPGGYFGLEPHQDWPSVQGSFDGMVAWIPLTTVGPDNFPLELVPGSHRRGLRPPHDGNTADKWVVREYADPDFVPVYVEPGDVVFMTNFTVHRSGLGGHPEHLRLACSTRYDNGDEPSFIERAYPTAYTRGVQRELMDFDDVDAVNAALAGMSGRW